MVSHLQYDATTLRKYCYGKTPQQTFEQGQEIVRDKHIQSWHDRTTQQQNEPDNIELDSKEGSSSIVGSAPREDMNTIVLRIQKAKMA